DPENAVNQNYGAQHGPAGPGHPAGPASLRSAGAAQHDIDGPAPAVARMSGPDRGDSRRMRPRGKPVEELGANHSPPFPPSPMIVRRARPPGYQQHQPRALRQRERQPMV